MSNLRILLFTMSSQDHIDAILGLAGVLKPYGHELIFTLAPTWERLIKSKGYSFISLRMDFEEDNEEAEDGGEDGGKRKKVPNVVWIDFFKRRLEMLRENPMEALEKLTDQKLVSTHWTWSAEMTSYDQPLENAIKQIKPDLVICDFPCRLPCLIKLKSCPWIQLWSSNPVAVYKEACPPEGTGFSVHDPKEKWAKYRELFQIKYKPLRDKINRYMIDSGVEPYKPHESLYLFESPYMNIYNYPEALDYIDIAPRPDKWYRMDAEIREPDGDYPFVIPDQLAGKPGRLVYFSLGSMGSVDVTLMNRVMCALAKSPHRFIVSKGPLPQEIKLPDNCWGDRYLDQIAILPHVDLVITHGGNNTLTESLYFAKPLIVMPISNDQLDNAQRIEDKKLGIRLNTDSFTEEQLLEAIVRLLEDNDLKKQLESIANDMRTTKTRDSVVQRIEEMVSEFKSNDELVSAL